MKADGVDAAFIVPVCPNCSRTVCGIAYYLESEGIQTAGIALFREIAETMRPPRILWVSFRWVDHLVNLLMQSSRLRSSNVHWGCSMLSRGLFWKTIRSTSLTSIHHRLPVLSAFNANVMTSHGEGVFLRKLEP